MTETTSPKVLARIPIEVRWSDLDAFNHVNNATYLTYLEQARIDWLKQQDDGWYGPHSIPVMVASHVHYRRPISWPADILVELTCDRLGERSLTIGHRIVAAGDDDTLYSDGNIVAVWMDPASGQSVPLPESIRAVLA